MNVTEVLDEIKKLSPTEKKQAMDALLRDRESNGGATQEERQIALFKQLQAEGVIKNIPPRLIEKWDFEPVRIKGKPLSESIIEERR